MIERFLQFLACPVDGASSLELHAAEYDGDGTDQRDVLEGALVCPQCRRWYPISHGIPTLFPDELRGGPEDARYLDRFGDQLERLDVITFETRDDAAAEIAAEKKREIELRDSECELYDELYPDDLHTTERKDYDELLPVDPDDTILDAGCGTGRLTKDYISRCKEIVGSDFSWESLRRFREKLTPEQRTRLHLVQADMCSMPLRSGLFDRLLCTGALCFIPWEEQRQKALAELSRSLKPGGSGAINVYHYSWMKRLKSALGFKEANQKEGFHSDGAAHYVNVTRGEMRDWLGESFQVDRIRGVYYRLPLVGKLAPRFSDRLDARLGKLGVFAPVLANELTAVVKSSVNARSSMDDPGTGSATGANGSRNDRPADKGDRPADKGDRPADKGDRPADKGEAHD